MKNTKIITLALIAVIAISLLAGCSPKKPENYVYVSVYDGSKIVCAWEVFELKDEDGDGKTTVNDVLITVHNEKCKDGYANATGDYGLYITKLWGDTSGAYGYYVNDAMAMSLSDEVKSGGRVYAYIYSDKTAYSDAYTYFSTSVAEGKSGDKLQLKFYKIGFDENWATVALPVAGAEITVDGAKTGVKTGEDGSFTIDLPKKGAVVSATLEGAVIIPPILIADK